MTLPETIRAAIERKLAAEQLSSSTTTSSSRKRRADRKRIEDTGIRDFQTIAAEAACSATTSISTASKAAGMAKSNNSKFLMIGNRDNGLPLMFNIPTDSPAAVPVDQQTNSATP
jgi:hypothetical protein